MYNISILSIGDEICIGQIVNTNAAWIAEQMTSLGANVRLHLSIGDERNEIVESINLLRNKSDFIIVTGGLGPTHDDITKDVLNDYFEDHLVFDDDSFENITTMFRIRNRELSERNRMQAMVPSKCKVLRNSQGTAPGMLFVREDFALVSLPGVPIEMRAIMTDHIIDFVKEQIENKHSEFVKYKTLNTIGMPESTLADTLGDTSMFLQESDSLAFLPSTRGIRLRIGSKGSTHQQIDSRISAIESHILERAGKFVYSIGKSSIIEELSNLLISRNQTLSVAESCTGGLLSSEITALAGSSKYFLGSYVTYSNEMKISSLGVKPSTIEQNGAVSEETALEMAKGCLQASNSDYSISITGIAGPDGGTQDKPVGTVWVAVANRNTAHAKRFQFHGDRKEIRERAMNFSVSQLLNLINETAN